MSVRITGACYCRLVRYTITLDSVEQARTSICHCGNCKRFTGSANGITTKIPKSSFKITQGNTKVHKRDNGSGTLLTREFCGDCGSGILEYGANAGDNIYVFYGTQDDLDAFPPKGEFFCSQRYLSQTKNQRVMATAFITNLRRLFEGVKDWLL